MKVTIIGAGLMGPGIGTRLAAGGNDVKLIDTDPEQAQTLCRRALRARWCARRRG